MLPGTSIEVTKTDEGEYLLKGPYAEATVNTTTEVFTSDDYMGFTNLMDLLQEGMDNVYYDGAPFVRYNRQELTPASATVTFEFQKYGIDLRSDDNTVYFPLATLSDIYSDLYYHVAGFNGENVDVITDNSNGNIAKFNPEGVKRVLASESRSADMAAFSYGELCFVVDHFYGMPGRSPLEEAIRNDGLDAALNKAEHGAQIKTLLKSTDMKEYIFGMDCLQLLLDDGGHTMTLVDIMAAEYFEETEEENLDDNDDLDNLDDNDNDKVVRHNLNIGVLTTDIAFSCGNLFPSLMKDMGFPIIGEKSGGGACAIQQFITPEGLQYQLSSARARLTNNRWENIDGGIEPDLVIDLSDNDGMQDYSALYDFATIGAYISNAIQTGIQELPAATVAADGHWFTPDGRRLQGQPTTKGLYIRGGKKMVVK
jgi:hypothetical protein